MRICAVMEAETGCLRDRWWDGRHVGQFGVGCGCLSVFAHRFVVLSLWDLLVGRDLGKNVLGMVMLGRPGEKCVKIGVETVVISIFRWAFQGQ